MKVFRFIHDGAENFGVLEDTDLVMARMGPSGGWENQDRRVKLSDVKLLPPVSPTKVVALGLNYRDHAREMGMAIPEEPIIFLKPSTSVIGPGDSVIYPGGGITGRVDYEAELGIVIGRQCRNVKASDAHEVILGYTCVNDVTARDLQARDGQWSRAKGFDTFCPIGPCLETDLDTADLEVKTVLNGKTVQQSSTRELIFDVPRIVEMISRVMTLMPGDVIATGTPPGVGPMNPGDTVTVSVEGVGKLTNKVAREPGWEDRE